MSAATRSSGDRPFIAPPPVEAPSRLERPLAAPSQAARQQPAAAEPTAAAPAEPRRRMPNLFARVTGGAAAWARQTSSDLRDASPAAMINRIAGQEQAGRAGSVPAAGSVPSNGAAGASAPQPRLAGLDSKERLSAGQADEDLLDIPAFLRRQAN